MISDARVSLGPSAGPGGRLRMLAAGLGRSDSPVAVLAFVVYLVTTAPGVTGYDSAELATGAYTLGIVHPTGYPLYLLLARLFTLIPVGSVAYRVNLLSAVCAALAVWLTARLSRRLTGSAWGAWVGAGFLAFSHSFWSLSVVAEVYTLQAFFVALILVLLERWVTTRDERWLRGLSLAFGLSLTNHVSGGLLGPGLACAILRTTPRRRVLRLAPQLGLLFVLGLLPYAYLPLRSLADPALNYVSTYYNVDLRTLSGLWWMVSGQGYRFFSFGYDLAGYLRELAAFAGLLLRNFTPLGTLLGLVGLVSLIRRRHPLVTATALGFVLTVAFFAGYAVGDKATMYVPAYPIWALWVAEGFRRSLRLFQTLGARIMGGTTAPEAVLRWGLAGIVLVMCAFNWRWVDMSQARGPDIFARQALATVAPNAMVVGQWSTAVILEYYQMVEGLRPDVVVFNRSRFEVAQYYDLWTTDISHDEAVSRIFRSEGALLETASRQRPLYIMEYDPRLAGEYEYQPAGNVFRLVPSEPGENRRREMGRGASFKDP